MDIYKLPRLNMSISTNDLTLIQDNSDNNISSTLKKYIHNAKKTIEDYRYLEIFYLVKLKIGIISL